MTDRERLIELLQHFADGTYTGNGWIVDSTQVDDVADYLLANGVIVPPCKVGQKVWLINNPREYEVLNFHFTGQILWATLILIEEPTIMREIDTKHFGETVFLTRKEAEQALKEREQNDR